MPSGGIEFHLSIYRDQLLASAYGGVLAYQPNNPDGQAQDNIEMMFNVGPGLQSLILDSFLFELFYTIALTPDGQRTSAVVIDLRKVY